MGLPPFRPSRHGFPFANEYDYSGHQLGRGAPVTAAFGLGAGLCWAALDRYLAGRRMPRPLEAPSVGEPLYLELVQRQANAIMRMGWEKALRWQRLPDEGSGSAAGLAEMTRVEWRWVRRSLDAGTPVLLFLIRASGAFESPFENQFVLAYRYEVDHRAGRLAIWVYDPNRPENDEVRLTLADGPRRAPLQAHLALKDEVRGFFSVPYDREVPPSLAVEEGRVAEGGAPLVLAGVPSIRLGRGRRLEVVALGPGQELVVASRHVKGGWRTEEVERRGGIAPELRPAGAPVLAPRGPLRAFARAPSGELVEYSPRAFSGWRARSITALSGGAHGYGVDSDPALLATGTSLSLFARHGGDAVHFHLRRGRWHAENLSVRAKLQGAHDLLGQLVATRGPDGTRHVFGRTADGHLLHFRWRQDAGWAAQCVTSNLERFGIVDDPVALELPEDRAVHVLARSATGLPLDFRWSADSGWRVRAMIDDVVIASPLSAAVGPDGTLHAVARADEGQLFHFWSRGELAWRARDVTSSNAALGEAYRIEGDPRLAVGPGEWLHVLARGGEDLLVYRWSPDADWTAEGLSRDRGSSAALAAEPVVLRAPDGAVHALGVDANGMPVYVRAGVDDAPARRALQSTWIAFGYAVVDLLALPGSVLARVLGGRRRRKARGRPVRAAAPAERRPPTAPRPRLAEAYDPPARPAPPDSFAADPLPRGWGNPPEAKAAILDPFAADPLPRGWGNVPAENAPPIPDPYAANSLPAGWGMAQTPASGPLPPEPVLPGLVSPMADVPDPYASATLPPEWGTAPSPASHVPVGQAHAAAPVPGAQELEEALRLAASPAEALPAEAAPSAGAAFDFPPLVLPDLEASAVKPPAPEPREETPAGNLDQVLDRWEPLEVPPAEPTDGASDVRSAEAEPRAAPAEALTEIPPIIVEIPAPEPAAHPLAEERGFFDPALEPAAPGEQLEAGVEAALVEDAGDVALSFPAPEPEEVAAEWDRESAPEVVGQEEAFSAEEPPPPEAEEVMPAVPSAEECVTPGAEVHDCGIDSEYSGPWAPAEETGLESEYAGPWAPAEDIAQGEARLGAEDEDAGERQDAPAELATESGCADAPLAAEAIGGPEPAEAAGPEPLEQPEIHAAAPALQPSAPELFVAETAAGEWPGNVPAPQESVEAAGPEPQCVEPEPTELTLPASFGTPARDDQLELLSFGAPRRMPYPIPIDPVRTRTHRRREPTLFTLDDGMAEPGASRELETPPPDEARESEAPAAELALAAEPQTLQVEEVPAPPADVAGATERASMVQDEEPTPVTDVVAGTEPAPMVQEEETAPVTDVVAGTEPTRIAVEEEGADVVEADMEAQPTAEAEGVAEAEVVAAGDAPPPLAEAEPTAEAEMVFVAVEAPPAPAEPEPLAEAEMVPTDHEPPALAEAEPIAEGEIPAADAPPVEAAAEPRPASELELLQLVDEEVVVVPAELQGAVEVEGVPGDEWAAAAEPEPALEAVQTGNVPVGHDLSLGAEFELPDLEDEPLGPAVESPAAPLFDLDRLERPFVIVPQSAATTEPAGMDLALPPGAEAGEEEAHGETGVPEFALELGGVNPPMAPTAAAGPPQRPPLPPANDPLIATIDQIIAEAYRKREPAAPKQDASSDAGFPQIPALPDYLILAPEKDVDAAPALPAEAAQPPGAPQPTSPAGVQAGERPQVRLEPAARRPERTSERIAALEGLPLLEPLPLPADAEPLPDLPLPAIPASASGNAEQGKNGKAPLENSLREAGAARRSAEATPGGSDRPVYLSEREAVLAGLPLLEPLDDEPDASGPS